MTVKEVLERQECKEILGQMIESYNHRPAPEKGRRWRRTPYDNLKDKGLFTSEALTEEFFRVDTGVSDLPKSERTAVGEIVIEAARKAYEKIESANKKTEEAPK